MKKYKIYLSKTAKKFLEKTKDKTKKRIKKKLKLLEKEPYKKRAKVDIKKLTGSFDPELFRLRVGDYRVIYTIQKSNIKVTEIIKREKGYKWLK